MATPTVRRASIGDLVSATRQRLLDKEVVTSSDAVIVIAKGNPPPHAKPTRDILIRVGPSHLGGDEGGGRWTARKVRTVSVYARTALALDKGYGDEKWLIAQDAFEDQILDALLDVVLFDADDNALTQECLHVVRLDRPEKDNDDVWGSCVLSFEVMYQPVLNQADNG